MQLDDVNVSIVWNTYMFHCIKLQEHYANVYWNTKGSQCSLVNELCIPYDQRSDGNIHF